MTNYREQFTQETGKLIFDEKGWIVNDVVDYVKWLESELHLANAQIRNEIVTKYHELNQLEVQKNKYTITALDDIVRCHLESLSTKQIKP